MMKTLLLALVVLATGISQASEEDYASISSIRLEAQTTENTFGTVIVSATITNGMEGQIFSSLAVESNGKTHSVPQDQLNHAARVYHQTLTVSSEVGYPHRGMGPYLFIRFEGHDGTMPAKFLVVFDESGFKELKTTGIQQGGGEVRR